MYDYCIIGGGVIGTAVARELSRFDVKTVLVEAENDVCVKASGANSAVIHSGYDPLTGSLKAKYNVQGYKVFARYCEELDVPYKKTGTLTLATNEEENRTLKNLLKRGKANGAEGLKILNREQALKLEPNLADVVTSALYSPEAGIVNPFELVYAQRENAENNGVKFIFNFIVKKSSFGDGITLTSSDGKIVTARSVINCAGEAGGDIARLLGDFHPIKYAKGEYALFDKAPVVSRPCFPTPDEKGKGIAVAPTLSGNFFVGPTSVKTEKRDTTFDKETYQKLLRHSAKLIKNVGSVRMLTTYVGLRANAMSGDFIIEKGRNNGVYHVIGISSPGLTSAPAIATELVRSFGLRLSAKFTPKRSRIKRLANCSTEDKNALIIKNKAYGNIICRCECVSEAEIVEAIRRGARDIAGIKKRLRASMGKCQGCFCSHKITAILEREMEDL